MEKNFEIGCDHFNDAEYFEAHEVWEEIWLVSEGARHAFLQCLIQVAVALHHAQNNNFVGTRKLFASSLGYLEKGRAESNPVDLDQLKDSILDFEIALQKKEVGEEIPLPFFKLPVRG